MNILPEQPRVAVPVTVPSPASQTLVRGLDILEHVADGPAALSAIARGLGLSRSTVHRLAATLIERRYLTSAPERGYALGPKLLELGFLARSQISLVRLTRPFLEALAARTGDVAMLCVRDGAQVRVAESVHGRRRLAPSLRPGDHLDPARSAAARVLKLSRAQAGADANSIDVITDLAESEPDINCVAAPVRGADGGVQGALCVAGASAYLAGPRLDEARRAVATAAQQASEQLGWLVSNMHGDAEAAEEAAERLLQSDVPSRLDPSPARVAEGLPVSRQGSGARKGGTRFEGEGFEDGDRDRMKGRPA